MFIGILDSASKTRGTEICHDTSEVERRLGMPIRSDFGHMDFNSYNEFRREERYCDPSPEDVATSYPAWISGENSAMTLTAEVLGVSVGDSIISQTRIHSSVYPEA